MRDAPPGLNAALLAVVAILVAPGWPAAQAALTWDAILFFFILAVLANIAYCAVYAVAD